MPDSLPRGITPRLLNREAAAEYCGLSPNSFDVYIATVVKPQEFGRRNLWDRAALDRWLDERSGLVDAPDSVEVLVGRLRDGGAGAR